METCKWGGVAPIFRQVGEHNSNNYGLYSTQKHMLKVS
jgi:hypothetical protein